MELMHWLGLRNVKFLLQQLHKSLLCLIIDKVTKERM